MKTVKLLKLDIQNFKGVKSHTFTPGGKDVRVMADNGVGKTTLFDAYHWLLTGLDSEGKKSFEIKRKKDGVIIPKQDVIVRGEFEVDGMQRSFERRMVERYRYGGTDKEAFDGNDTVTLVDDVPQKRVSDFDKKVDEIIDKTIFKLISSPTAFAQLPKDKKRELIFEVAGTVDDEEVAKYDEAFADAEKLIGARTLDETRKMYRDNVTAYRKQLQEIQVRIKEQTEMEIHVLDTSAAEAELKEVEKTIDAINAEIHSIQNGTAIEAKRNNLQSLKNELETERNKVINSTASDINDAKEELRKLQNELEHNEEKRKTLAERIANGQSEVETVEKELAELREKRQEVFVEVAPIEVKEVCECCKQSIPTDLQQQVYEEMTRRFILDKAERLKEIDGQGLKLAEKKKKYESAVAGLEKDLQEVPTEVEGIEELQSELKKLEEDRDIQLEDVERQYSNSIRITQEDIDKLLESAAGATAELEKRRKELLLKKETLNEVVSQKYAEAQRQTRIKELQEEEKETQVALDDAIEKRELMDAFAHAKFKLMQTKVDDKFKIARFELFKHHQNGNVDDICEITNDKGVMYEGGLSNAERINVGLDICNTLQQHYGVSVPIFVDNAESNNDVLDVDAQLILLTVTKHKTLRMEEVNND